MKLNKLTLVVTAILTAAFLAPLTASAQTINHRLHRQHHRIAQGLHHHHLTNRTARRLAVRDRAIHLRERADRLAHRGHLTAGERARLQRRLNRTSRAIYRDKHD